MLCDTNAYMLFWRCPPRTTTPVADSRAHLGEMRDWGFGHENRRDGKQGLSPNLILLGSYIPSIYDPAFDTALPKFVLVRPLLAPYTMLEATLGCYQSTVFDMRMVLG